MKEPKDFITSIFVPLTNTARNDLRFIHKKLLAEGKTNVTDDKIFAGMLLTDVLNQLKEQVDPPVIIQPKLTLS